jgi:hypothetical protein
MTSWLAQWLPQDFDGFAWPWLLLALPLPWLLRRLLPPVADASAAALKVPFGKRLGSACSHGWPGGCCASLRRGRSCSGRCCSHRRRGAT